MSSGIQLTSLKVKTIKTFQRPENVCELRGFLEIVNFYCRFLSKAVTTQKPFKVYFKGTQKRQASYSLEAEEAFKQFKNDLRNAALLVHPLDSAPLVLTTDASDYAVAAVLEQVMQDGREPLGFFSRKFTETQQRYNAYDC